MLAKRIALVVVGLAVIAIVAVKTSARRAAAPSPTVVAAAVVPAAVASATRPSVVLVADPREADAQCPCGEIIRRVRAAKAHGVAIEELAPDSPDAGRRYGVTVTPTVLFLDASGHVISRREGESGEILAAVTADLAKLEAARR